MEKFDVTVVGGGFSGVAAALAAASGCPYEVGRTEDGLCQAMMLCFRVINVDVDKFSASMYRVQGLYDEAKKSPA